MIVESLLKHQNRFKDRVARIYVPISSQLSYYLLNSGFSNLIAPPASALEGLPVDCVPVSAVLNGARWVAYFWSEETKDVPVFTSLITTHFDETFEPDLAERYSALLFLEVSIDDPYDENKKHERVMALTFGSGYTKFRSGSIQQQFGKTLLINIADPANLQKLKKNIPGARGKTILEELHTTGSVFDFTQLPDIFDVSKIGAKTQTLGDKSADGADYLRIRGALVPEAIAETAKTLLLAFVSTKGRNPEFDDLEYIQEITDRGEMTQILSELHTKIVQNRAADFGVSNKPELQATERLVLKFKRQGSTRFEEPVDLTDYWGADTLISVIKDRPLQFGQFLEAVIAKQVYEERQWKDSSSRSIFNYISYVGDVRDRQVNYPVPFRQIVNENHFYRCPAIVHDRLANRLASVKLLTSRILPPFDRAVDRDGRNMLSEGAYNTRASQTLGYALFDRPALRVNVNKSRIEFCDLFNAGEMYCVKRTIESDAVNKVCQQAMDAALTLEHYREEWLEAVQVSGINFDKDPQVDRGDFKFIIALIAPIGQHNLASLNLKSKLALARARGEIQQRGYLFEIHFIVDPGI